MKIYQIHAIGGEYQNAYDDIVASYLHKDAAQNRLEELKIEQQRKKEAYVFCSECPIHKHYTTSYAKKKAEQRCQGVKIMIMEEGIYCSNNDYYYYAVHHNELDELYEIEEVDVIE